MGLRRHRRFDEKPPGPDRQKLVDELAELGFSLDILKPLGTEVLAEILRVVDGVREECRAEHEDDSGRPLTAAEKQELTQFAEAHRQELARFGKTPAQFAETFAGGRGEFRRLTGK